MGGLAARAPPMWLEDLVTADPATHNHLAGLI
jgi:hypothetical protein